MKRLEPRTPPRARLTGGLGNPSLERARQLLIDADGLAGHRFHDAASMRLRDARALIDGQIEAMEAADNLRRKRARQLRANRAKGAQE